MKGFLLTALICGLFFLPIAGSPQKHTVRKFGDVTADDFSPKAYPIDSSANGVILFDVGSSKYEGNTAGHFSIIFNRHTRIRLLNRNSFDLANISIPLYASGPEEEKVEHLEAATFNLENGTIVQSKLDKASIFKDRLNKYYTVRKFTLPNLKEGSIIDIKYTLVSPYERDLRFWYFQGEYPRLWSEYEVVVPAIYDFAVIHQGFIPFVVDTATARKVTYSIIDQDNSTLRAEHYTFTTNVVDQTWAVQNVPAIKDENFTTNTSDYVSKVDFQLSRIAYPERPVKNVMSNWHVLSEDLLNHQGFGKALSENNYWINDERKQILSGEMPAVDMVKKIYYHIRDNITCNDYSARFLSNPLKKTYQTKNGNVVDINMLLTAFLLNAGFDAKPVLLSTRQHGKASSVYPIFDKYNYLITQVKIDERTYLLDASQSRLGFGHLDQDCYNGDARVIDKEYPFIVNLSADSLREVKSTSVFIINKENGGLTGSYTSNLGEYGSLTMRKKIAKTSLSDYFNEIKKSYSFDIKITNPQIDSLKNYEENISVKYDFDFENDEDIVYLNPIFGDDHKENPFKSAERMFPVEMPYASQENYIFQMEIPKGYAVDELPKSSRVRLNENDGLFEYLVAKENDRIQLRSTIKLNKATFDPQDYETLRLFFGHIVKKHSEQIVLKKTR